MYEITKQTICQGYSYTFALSQIEWKVFESTEIGKHASVHFIKRGSTHEYEKWPIYSTCIIISYFHAV